jgi:hypothetical protein
MSYCQSYESAHFAICERIEHARRKHPEELTFLERLDTILDELCEVEAEVLKGDYARAMNEYKDVGATLYRAMEELHRYTGERIR